MNPFIRILLPLVALLSAMPRAGADDGKVGVDVVMDFTPAGKKLPLATTEHPVYYLPIPVGLEEKGPTLNEFQRTPPRAEQIEHLIAKMLAEQHYLLMTKTGHPSIVLTIKWGYKAPAKITMGSGNHGQSAGTQREGGANPNNFKAFQDLIQVTTNDAEMNDLVAGHLIDLTDGNLNSGTGATNVKDQALNQMAQTPRWYIQLVATDFNDWLHHKVTPLWRENVSTELWGHCLDEVIPTMVAAAGPYLGRPMDRPAVATVPVNTPPGWVTIGKSVVVPNR